jgi:hypothetical protein
MLHVLDKKPTRIKQIEIVYTTHECVPIGGES